MTEVDNIEAAKRMVERGLGVALLPGTAIADALSAGSLLEIELAGTSPFLNTLWELLDRIPELIPRALPITAAGSRPPTRRAARSAAAGPPGDR